MDNDPTTEQVVALSGQGLPPCGWYARRQRGSAALDGQCELHHSGQRAELPHLDHHPGVREQRAGHVRLLSCHGSRGGSAALTVQNLPSVPSDNFNFTVTGTDATVTTSVGLVVLLSDFTFTPYPGTSTVTAGQTATYAMTLTPVNGLAGTIQLPHGYRVDQPQPRQRHCPPGHHRGQPDQGGKYPGAGEEFEGGRGPARGGPPA